MTRAPKRKRSGGLLPEDGGERIILVSGGIRDLGVLSHVMESALGLWADGAVDRVIMTAWRADLTAHQGLAEDLIARGTELLTLSPPHDFGLPALVSDFHAVHRGLRLTDMRDSVLRLSPDIFMDFDRIPALFEAWDSAPPPDPTLPRVFERRIWLSHAGTVQPCLANPALFLGQTADLLKLGQPDLCLEALAGGVPHRCWPEERFLLTALLPHFPVLQEYRAFLARTSRNGEPGWMEPFLLGLRHHGVYREWLGLWLRLLDGLFMLARPAYVGPLVRVGETARDEYGMVSPKALLDQAPNEVGGLTPVEALTRAGTRLRLCADQRWISDFWASVNRDTMAASLMDGANRALTHVNDPPRREAFHDLMVDLFGPLAEG
ncbi:MAG: hypothetical protein K9H25_05480 [Rhodospirillum sp.]|nr:hypothetical protein [Rhodospirillum sp.]MCF8488940.1 hypothetical protein [Rhodospirillum sp.]MCF8498996.1 hypothetical protein [Rhodospirillum sp.]